MVLGVLKKAYQSLPGWHKERKCRIFVWYFLKKAMVPKGCLSEWPPTRSHAHGTMCCEQRSQGAWSWRPQVWGHHHYPCSHVCVHPLPIDRVMASGAGKTLAETISDIESWIFSAPNDLNSLFNLVILHKSSEPKEETDFLLPTLHSWFTAELRQ